MPAKGYQSITIKAETANILKKLAHHKGVSLVGYCDYLLQKLEQDEK